MRSHRGVPEDRGSGSAGAVSGGTPCVSHGSNRGTASFYTDTDQLCGLSLSSRSVATLLETLSWSGAAMKSSAEPKVVGVAKSLSMDEAKLPGWFFTLDYELVRVCRLTRDNCRVWSSLIALLLHRSRPSHRRRSFRRHLRSTRSFATRRAGASSYRRNVRPNATSKTRDLLTSVRFRFTCAAERTGRATRRASLAPATRASQCVCSREMTLAH